MYHCKTCGQTHDDLPDIGGDKPDPWFGLNDKEKAKAQLTSDTCIIEDDYFVRGVIQIPLHDYHRPFGFGVWVSLKKENFNKYLAHFDSNKIGPFFGWLCTRIAYFEDDTYLLKTQVHFQSGNQRPHIELEPTDHPLAVAQREGMSLEQAWEIVHFYMKDGV